jgi:hypothetical protein
MATGSGKTFTAVNFIYRLVKYGGAKRVLFLVDRGNLGEQTLKEFQQFVSPVNNYKFTEEYIVQHLSSNALDKSARVVIGTNYVTALVIKWKTPAEIEAEKATLARLTGRLTQQHPDLAAKRELVDLATELVRFQGLSLDSDEASQQLEKVLTEVVKSPKEGQTKWLFRGTLRAGSLTASMSDTVYGVANVTIRGEGLTIVSSSEKSDLTFSGSVKDGQLSGQVGFSAGSSIFSAKADGVYTDEKISLTGQGQTPDGTFQASFSFTR